MKYLRPFRITAIWSAILLGCLLPITVTQAADPSDYQIKAVFLLNFTKFISWPPLVFESAVSPFSICILGEDPFGRDIDQIVEGESVNGRRIVVERVRQAPVPRSCRVLFVSKSAKDIPAVLASLGAGVLTVSDRDAFLNEGGMIDFLVEDRRVRFDINQGVALRASLMMSSRLLKVARIVQK